MVTCSFCSCDTWSIAIVNRNRQSTPISIALAKDPGKPFRKYIYEPAHIPVTEDGDLQEPAGKLAASATIRNEFVDAGPTRNEPGEYTVVAVDRSGNASQPQRTPQYVPNQAK